MRRLTARQAQVLRFIGGFIDSHGFPPTVREIGDHFGWSSTTAPRDHVAALSRKGALTRTAKQSRTLALTDLARDFLSKEPEPNANQAA